MSHNYSRRLGLILAIVVIGQSLGGPQPTVASQGLPPIHQIISMPETYSASAAVAYAENWVEHTWTCGNSAACGQKQNPAYMNYDPADCTNYVSQALAAGGFQQMYSGGSPTHYDAWWSNGTSGNSNTWSVAPMLLNFLWIHSPGGILTAYWSPNVGQTARSGTQPGGVIFYDWGWLGGGEGVSHASIVVAYGTDPAKGWVGDLVDMHSTDRYHAFWTLEPYNGSNLASTTYTVVGIAAGN